MNAQRSMRPKIVEAPGVRPGAILRAMGAAAEAVAVDGAKPGRVESKEPCRRDPPRLELEQQGGRVERIIAICGCGERIVIECDYAAPVGAKP